MRAAIKQLASFHAICYAFLYEYAGGLEQAKHDLKLFFWKYDDYFDWVKETEPFRAVTNDSQRAMFKGLEEKNPDTKYYKYLEDLIDT